MIRRAPVDISHLNRAVDILEGIAARRKEGPAARADATYYQALADYLRHIREGWEQGKPLVMHNTMTPAELFYAMDVVPVDLEYCGTLLGQLLGAEQEAFSTARTFGLTPEVCSTYHMIVASIIHGWLPPASAVVWMKSGCDNSVHCGQWVSRLNEAPGFFIDKPYRQTPAELDYFTRELQGAVTFLEGLTHRPMDWDRLREVLRYSVEVCRLHLQIRELRKLDPPPLRSRRKLQMIALGRIQAGAPQAVEFYQAVLEECQHRMASQLTPTRLRLLSLFRVPNYAHKLYDWMENEHGAYLVMEPNHEYRGEVAVDENDLLGTIARRTLIQPGDTVYEGPATSYVRWAVADAKEFRAQGALFFALRQCRQGSGVIKMLKDALAEECGIPMAVLDCDLVDASVAPLDQLKEKLEEYFEMLAG